MFSLFSVIWNYIRVVLHFNREGDGEEEIPKFHDVFVRSSLESTKVRQYPFKLSSQRQFFTSHFIMGGERFDTSQVINQNYLFGDNVDLNHLYPESKPFPYPPPSKLENPVKTLKSLVHIRKNSIALVPVDGVQSIKFNIQFIFDCDSECYISIHYFCYEHINYASTRSKHGRRLSLVSYRPDLTSLTYHFKAGSNILFDKRDHVFCPASCSKELVFLKKNSVESWNDVIPIAIHCRTYPDTNESDDYVIFALNQSHLTTAAIEKVDTVPYSVGKISSTQDEASEPSCIFNLKHVKQKVFADGLLYLLQDIYGVEKKIGPTPEEASPKVKEHNIGLCQNNDKNMFEAIKDDVDEVKNFCKEYECEQIRPRSAIPLFSASEEREDKRCPSSFGDMEKAMDSGDSTNIEECVVCMTELKDTLILPCKHFCLCYSCAESLRYQANSCPICRSSFIALLQIRAARLEDNSSNSRRKMVRRGDQGRLQTYDPNDSPHQFDSKQFKQISVFEALNGSTSSSISQLNFAKKRRRTVSERPIFDEQQQPERSLAPSRLSCNYPPIVAPQHHYYFPRTTQAAYNYNASHLRYNNGTIPHFVNQNTHGFLHDAAAARSRVRYCSENGVCVQLIPSSTHYPHPTSRQHAVMSFLSPQNINVSLEHLDDSPPPSTNVRSNIHVSNTSSPRTSASSRDSTVKLLEETTATPTHPPSFCCAENAEYTVYNRQVNNQLAVSFTQNECESCRSNEEMYNNCDGCTLNEEKGSNSMSSNQEVQVFKSEDGVIVSTLDSSVDDLSHPLVVHDSTN